MRESFAVSSYAHSGLESLSAANSVSTTGGRPARVAFVGQAGAAAGGAERTLATFLEFAPPDILPTVILFEEGQFADELRRLLIPVEIVRAPGSIAQSRREQLRFDAAIDSLGLAVRLARRFRELHIDVVYSNTMKAHFACGPAARLAGLPCIMHFHDVVDGVLLQALRLVARIGSIERVACSRLVSEKLGLDHTTVSYGPFIREAYRTLPNRSEARAKLGLPKTGSIVALVGRINRWKGHDRFLRIAAEVNKVSRVHFAIVGSAIFRDADFVPELEHLACDLGIEDRISFIPWVDDIRSVYAAIDVNVNCSTREPFGRSVAEAAGAGVPSVCFDDSGAAETIFNRCTGWIVPAGDETAFAQAVVQCLASASHPETSVLVRHSAIRFDANDIAEELAQVIRRAVQNTRLTTPTAVPA